MKHLAFYSLELQVNQIKKDRCEREIQSFLTTRSYRLPKYKKNRRKHTKKNCKKMSNSSSKYVITRITLTVVAYGFIIALSHQTR